MVISFPGVRRYFNNKLIAKLIQAIEDLLKADYLNTILRHLRSPLWYLWYRQQPKEFPAKTENTFDTKWLFTEMQLKTQTYCSGELYINGFAIHLSVRIAHFLIEELIYVINKDFKSWRKSLKRILLQKFEKKFFFLIAKITLGLTTQIFHPNLTLPPKRKQNR